MTYKENAATAPVGEELPRRKTNGKRAKLIAKITVYVLLGLYTLWVIFPFLVILLTSLTSQEQLSSTMNFVWLPKPLTMEAYRVVLFDDIYAAWLYGDALSSILHGFLNTMWQVVPSTLVGLFISGLSAYAFAKIRFKGSDVLFMCLVATMMVPGAVLTMPSYLFYDAIHWTNTVLPLIIPGLFGAAGVTFFLRQFFRGLPDELIEAARIDGLNDFSVYVRIIMPLSAPAFIAQGVFMFVGGYNNYQGPLLYLSNYPQLAPLQLAVQLFMGGYGNPAIRCAAAVVALLPLLVLYCFLQKYFTQGVAMTGLKA